MSEILAPAGNAECAKAAIDNGADAIYLGYSAFSARQSAENFDGDGLRDIVLRAHLCGVKVYVAMNTIVKDEETESFLNTLLCVWNMGADAVILQDILLGKAVHGRYPDIVLHLSTQAGVCTANGAEFAKSCGFSRVILARETPFSEIEKIAKIIETEAFVQGALCTCFSGQCYFSSFAGGNSGNRGRCKQPCRKAYAFDRKGFEEKSYALSLSDLCVGEDIGKYIAAGVESFKIEGRMRRAEYVAAAVRYYRNLLDGGEGKERERGQALSDLKRTYNRGNYTKGLAFGQDKRLLSSAIQGHMGEKIGVVTVRNGKFFVESAFQPRQGDAFKILRAGREIGGAFFVKSEPRGFSVSSKARLKNGDGVFVTTDNEVNERVRNAQKRAVISLSLYFHEHEKATAFCKDFALTSEEEMPTAQSRALTEEELRACFSKTDGLPLEVRFESVDLRGNIFLPKSALNAFRRRFYEKLCERAAGERKLAPVLHTERCVPEGKNEKLAVIVSDLRGVNADIVVYKPSDYAAPLPAEFAGGRFEKYLYYPPFVTEKEERVLQKRFSEEKLDGVYAENYGGIRFAEKLGVKVFAGTGLNVTNALSLRELLKIPCVAFYAVSKELNEREAAELSGEKSFALCGGDIKLMDLCYCPFGKTCASCDKKGVYALTDENGRKFPVRRYRGADGGCRFEVYNCAALAGTGVAGAGTLLDLTLVKDKAAAIGASGDTERQKNLYKNYTSGHLKRGVL